MSDKMREAFKVAFRKAASEDVDYDEAVDRGLAAALTAQAEQRGDVSGWYCAHCQHGVDPVDVTFGETHVYCGYPVTDCPAPPAPAVPDGWLRAIDEAMVVHHVGIADQADDYETARKKMNLLLCVAQDIGAMHAIPEGWKLVPVEPTDEMIYMMTRATANYAERLDSYAAMLAAAPEVKP